MQSAAKLHGQGSHKRDTGRGRGGEAEGRVRTRGVNGAPPGQRTEEVRLRTGASTGPRCRPPRRRREARRRPRPPRRRRPPARPHAGSRDPQFECLRIEIMRTDRRRWPCFRPAGLRSPGAISGRGVERGLGHGRLSKAQSRKMGPAPGRFEPSKGILK